MSYFKGDNEEDNEDDSDSSKSSETEQSSGRPQEAVFFSDDDGMHFLTHIDFIFNTFIQTFFSPHT